MDISKTSKGAPTTGLNAKLKELLVMPRMTASAHRKRPISIPVNAFFSAAAALSNIDLLGNNSYGGPLLDEGVFRTT